MNANVERTTIRKVYLRLLPLLFVSYFVCYLDRINVGFAALTMNKDLGFTATVFALGATAFFWGYCLFEIPSNIVLEKIGARVWIARIMITWGFFPAPPPSSLARSASRPFASSSACARRASSPA